MAGSFGGFSSLAGAPQGLQQAYMRDPRLRLAQQLQLQGADASPVQHWTQGAARLAQALAGNYVQDRADGEYKKQADQYQADIGSLYAPVMQPGAGGAGPRPDAQMRAPNVNELQQRMASMQSPYALEAARPMLQSAMERQAAMEAEARKPFNLRPGEQRMDASGRVIANNPIVEKPQAPPASVAEFQFAQQNGFRGSFMDFQQAKARAGQQPERAARPLTPQERAQFGIPDNVPGFMGADNKPQIMNIPQQGETWDVDPANPLIQINRRTGERKAMPGAEKAEKAQEQAGNALIDTDRMIAQATELLNHPGRLAATGKSSLFNFIPGTDAYGFAKKLETLKAQVFLPEVQKMVGMGALSNAEGEKISAAFATLDPGMKEEEFQRSLQGALAQMQAARDRFAAKAAGGRPQPGSVSLGGQASAPLNINNLLDKYAPR